MTTGGFAEALQAYCFMTGGSVTSGGRTEKRNVAVGGVRYSAHRFFLASDVVYDEGPIPIKNLNPPGFLIDLDVAKETARRCGLRLIRENDHDHLQPLDWQPS